MNRGERVLAIAPLLKAEYPGDAAELCALRFETVFQLLVATVLSAQTTDVNVNRVTGQLFARFPVAPTLASADLSEVEEIIFITGFYRAKARHIVALAAMICDDFSGDVPNSRAELVKLPGVGRKTANVVLSVGFGLPGLAVDTHVARVAKRLGLTRSRDPVRIERDLCAVIPGSDWGVTSIRLILHGRAVCQARRPRCEVCSLSGACAYFASSRGAHAPVRGVARASGSLPKRD